MSEAVGGIKEQGFLNRFFGESESKSNLSDLIHESAVDSKEEGTSLVGRVSKGAHSVVKTLTSTELLVAITLLSVTTLLLVLTFPMIKPFLVGVPIFVALSGISASKATFIFLITKILATLGLGFSATGTAVKIGKKAGVTFLDFAKKFGEWLSKRAEKSSRKQDDKKIEQGASKEEASKRVKEKNKEINSSLVGAKDEWSRGFEEQGDSEEASIDTDTLTMYEKAWQNETETSTAEKKDLQTPTGSDISMPEKEQQAHTRTKITGGVTPSPVVAMEEPDDWSEEYLSSSEEERVFVVEDPQLDEAWARSTERGGRILSVSEERLMTLLQQLAPPKAKL